MSSKASKLGREHMAIFCTDWGQIFVEVRPTKRFAKLVIQVARRGTRWPGPSAVIWYVVVQLEPQQKIVDRSREVPHDFQVDHYITRWLLGSRKWDEWPCTL